MSKVPAEFDGSGRLLLPGEVRRRNGFAPGDGITVEETAEGLRLRFPATHLKKVYVEPTNRCNLDCRTCMRHAWDEAPGEMSRETFAAVIEGLRAFSPRPAVFFGGLGEPLSHPDILEMVQTAKSLGSSVELITNGILLDEAVSGGLIAAGLDRLWVSLDGASAECYGDVRPGGRLQEVLAHIRAFRNRCWVAPAQDAVSAFQIKPEIGIVFVAMKRNIHELPALLELAIGLGATRVMVTNILPHTGEMEAEILYSRTLTHAVYPSSAYRLDLPGMDIDDRTKEPLFAALGGRYGVRFAGSRLGEGNDRCPFVDGGAAAIGWDGGLSPCIPLLHSHAIHVHGRESRWRRHTVGNVRERPLPDLWREPGYLEFRTRVKNFDFAPCTRCGGCGLTAGNETDCLGSPFPACGNCLWAQGIVQCP